METLEDFRSNLSCKICFRMLYEPYTTQCGHTFCYSCLTQWFTDNNNVHKQTCPDCRAVVHNAPAPAYLVRDMAQKFVQQIHLLGDEDETLEQHVRLQQEEAAIVEQDRASEKGLFNGRFRRLRFSRQTLIHDAEDGVDRCPQCTWEMEDGDRECHRCGYNLDNNEYDSEMDSDYDPEDETIPMPWSPDSLRSDYPDGELDGDIDAEDAEVEDDFRTPRWSDGMDSDSSRAFRGSLDEGGFSRAIRVDELDDYDEDENASDTSRSNSYDPRDNPGHTMTDDEGDSTMGDFVVDEEDEGHRGSSDEEDDDGSTSESSGSTPRQLPARAAAQRPNGARRSNPYVISSSESDSTPPPGDDSAGDSRVGNNPPPRSDKVPLVHECSRASLNTANFKAIGGEREVAGDNKDARVLPTSTKSGTCLAPYSRIPGSPGIPEWDTFMRDLIARPPTSVLRNPDFDPPDDSVEQGEVHVSFLRHVLG